MNESNDGRHPQRGDPFCGECGYALSGLTESSRCPECGRPLVDVLMRRGFAATLGRRYRSKARLFGLPLIDIAFGPSHDEKYGKPRGIIAIGDVPTGLLAIGGTARGLVAIGGAAFGGLTLGGFSVGLISAAGGMAVGSLVFGGFAIGGLARGGGAVGVVADGGMAVGLYARGGGAFGPNVISPGRTDAAAQSMFDSFAWFFGSWPPTVVSHLDTAAIVIGCPLILALVIAFVVWMRWMRDPGPEPRS